MLKILLFIAFLGWGNASETLAMMDTDDEMTRSPMTSKRQSTPENCCTRMMNCLIPCFQTKPDAIQSTDLMDLGGRKKHGTNIPNDKRKEIVELLGEGNDQILLDPRNGPDPESKGTTKSTSVLNTTDINPLGTSVPSQNSPKPGKIQFKEDRYRPTDNGSLYSKIESDTKSKKNDSIQSVPYGESIQSNDQNNDKSEFYVAGKVTLLETGKNAHITTEKKVNKQNEREYAEDPDYYNRRRGQLNQGSGEESWCSKFFNWWGFSSSSTPTPPPVISTSISSKGSSIKSITYSQYTKIEQNHDGSSGGSSGGQSIFTTKGNYVEPNYSDKSSVHSNRANEVLRVLIDDNNSPR